MSSKATRSATSSPGSAVGPTPSGSPDGPTSGPSGPAPFRVSRFRALDSDVAMPIGDTPQVSNLAWMKAGIDPVLGDLIARQKIAERSWATEQEPG